MKKFVLAVSFMGLLISSVSAYNPPVNGESFLELSSPRQLTNASSTVGTGIFWVSPESIVVNPALPAAEQRIGLNLAYTALISTNSNNSSAYGNAFQGGILIPYKRAVMTTFINGVMSGFEEMNLGNSVNLKTGLSKEITEKFSLGANLSTGIFWGANTDWSLAGDLGFLYRWGKLGFIKDFRFGGSLLNLGKSYTNTTLPGIKGGDVNAGWFPETCTIKAGAAGLLFANDVIKIGASLDLTTPMFMNLIADAGIQFAVKDMLYLTVAEKLNVAEMVTNHTCYLPSVGLSFRFTFDVKNNEYLKKNGWNQSEMAASAAWKQLYGTVNAISAGVDVNLGMVDDSAPEIHLWIDEDDADAAASEGTSSEEGVSL